MLNEFEVANKDLVIGVGAFLSEKVGERYVGSAFSFNPNGLFKNFDCCKANDLESIVAGIRKAIGHFIVDSETYPERLIIHYYKTMSKREARPITQMLNTLGLNIPVLIVTINKTETSDIVMFDEKQQGYSALTHLCVKNMPARARQVASKNLPPAPSGMASPIYALRFGETSRANRMQSRTCSSYAEVQPRLSEGNFSRHPCWHRRHTLLLRSNPLRYASLGTHNRRAVLFSSAKRSFGCHSRLLFAPLNPNKVFAKLTKYL